MSITPTPPHVLNYTLFQNPQMSSPTMALEKPTGRRKQSFPTKANVSVDDSSIQNTQEKVETEEDSPMDFTGNSPWCSYIKSKVSKIDSHTNVLTLKEH